MSERNRRGLRKLVGPPTVTILRDDLLDPRLSLAARGLLASEPGGWHLEQSRHRTFADLRISPKTEWFRPNKSLVADINELRSGRAVA